MAEERTLGLARAQDYSTEGEPSKEELQRRLGEARDSITNTVTEIKETVANQVQAVKDTLDWKEQFKKRPVVWSAAALGVGFCTGYCIANFVKGDDAVYESAITHYGRESDYYTSQGLAGAGAAMATPGGPRPKSQHGNGSHDNGPSFFQKMAHTPAFERVKDEAGNIGDAFVQELSKTAKTVVLPALITSLRNFIGDYLPNANQQEQRTQTQRNQSPSYQPSLERNPS
ncbi:MAG TPA: hypothetical protein VJ306_19800 [Pyrinomonadaceae bacterium]|jgi:hypothetical protein|nr:hypothetical protein [Pyrinomonadaceae bacterium]